MAREIVDFPCDAGTLTGGSLLFGHIGKVLKPRIQLNQPRDSLAIVRLVPLESVDTLHGTSQQVSEECEKYEYHQRRNDVPHFRLGKCIARGDPSEKTVGILKRRHEKDECARGIGEEPSPYMDREGGQIIDAQQHLHHTVLVEHVNHQQQQKAPDDHEHGVGCGTGGE